MDSTTHRHGCYNHFHRATTVLVQSGWTADGRRHMVSIENPMTKPCQYSRSLKHSTDKSCTGCIRKQPTTDQP
jgi:hypothetical protein